MQPYIYLFGAAIPVFGIMVVIAMGAGFAVVFANCRIRREKATDPMLAVCIAIVGGFIGAFALRPLTRLPRIAANWQDYAEIPVGEFFAALFGEMVFYGGLLGGVVGAFLYCRKFKVAFLATADLIAPAIPVGHAFGRIACLLGGCCYGQPVSAGHLFAVVYPERTDGLESVAAPAGVPLLAVPAIEAGANLLIAAIVLLFGLRAAKRGRGGSGRCLALYGLLYGVVRFALEFFRGDEVRGGFGGLSTSQIISIGVVAASIALLTIKPRSVE
jgi:phosphatidylglycerol:prolipoprotein diacylglycerol transferase